MKSKTRTRCGKTVILIWHVKALMESFQATQKMNAKGLRLVLQDNDLCKEWMALSDEAREEGREAGSEFFEKMRALGAFAPYTGDHTRRAAAQLKGVYPQNTKWQHFKDVKVYIAADTQSDEDMIRDLGNVNNTVQSLHKTLAFSDKIKQIHTYFDSRGLLGDASGKKKSTGRSKDVAAYLRTTADSWGMQTASMGQLVTLAKCSGRAWDNLLQILNGQYRLPGAKVVGGQPPKAISHFNMLGNVPPNVTADLFAQIIAGALALNKLPKACQDYKAMHHLKLYVLDTSPKRFLPEASRLGTN